MTAFLKKTEHGKHSKVIKYTQAHAYTHTHKHTH